MSVLENSSTMDLVAAQLVSLGKVGGTSGLLDENGDWRDEAIQLVHLIEAHREGGEMSLLIASDLSSFRLVGWDECTERGLKALYFAEGWIAYRQMMANADPFQGPVGPCQTKCTSW